MQKATVRYLHLAPGAEAPVLDGVGPFKAVVVVESEVPDTLRWDLARWLVASGCRYALAWGGACEAWRESIEDASLEASDYEDVPDEALVITTAHEDEELGEAFWYARHRAVHPAHELKDTLIVHLAAAPRREEIEELYRDA